MWQGNLMSLIFKVCLVFMVDNKLSFSILFLLKVKNECKILGKKTVYLIFNKRQEIAW